MTVDDPRRDAWREELRAHQHAIERLRVEIARLECERCDRAEVGDFVRAQIVFARAQITRHHISAELVASRLQTLG